MGSSGGYSRPLTHGEKRVFKTLVTLFVIFILLFIHGNIVISTAGFGLTTLPVNQTENAAVYRASDLNLHGLFDRSPVSMRGNIVINGNLWHVSINCFSCAALTVNGDANYSKIGLGRGTLSVRGANHSMLLGLHVQTTGTVSNTRERGGTIDNRGQLGSGNDIGFDAALRRGLERNAASPRR